MSVEGMHGAVSVVEISPWRTLEARRIDASGAFSAAACDTAEETPIAFSYGGIAHAVMMATPADLHDFAVGFSVSEGIASGVADIGCIEIRASGDGFELNITLAPDAFRAFLSRRRVRSLRGYTSCGLCGVEDMADVERQNAEADRVTLGDGGSGKIELEAVRAALSALRDFQPLSRQTHAAHAAAWATSQGSIALVREDVGRHSALDKLIGACLRANIDMAAGFCVVTSRCSFEMVQKAVAARMPVLVAVSAPTALAVRRAEAAGLTLIARANANGQIIYAGPDRIRL
ncbi:MAG: formate dehydrogenase accessory sulfurtransferase FdhD [Methylocella sp.]